jgi:uncharacterized protein YdaU (DUF1376 family)
MSKPPAFQLYAADFYMDTNTWTIDEIGIYTRLLFSEWVNGPLPNDETRLARASGCGVKRFRAGWSQVKSKFTLTDDDKLFNTRLEDVRVKQKEYQEKQSVKGHKSAEKRWGDRVTTVTTAVTDMLQPDCNSSSSSSSSTLKNKDNNPPTPRKRVVVYSADFLSFYESYPKKSGRDAAWRAWKKRNGDRPAIEVIIKAVEEQKVSEQWTKDGGQYIKNPATWINQGCWADELPKGGTTSAPTQRYNQYGKPIPRAVWEDEAERITREYNERKAAEAAANSKAAKQP